MRSSSKSRSRNKNANRRNNTGGNVTNRVFDSAGPEGKVRGTPQQIIEKYRGLAHDAQLSGDRVSAENFQQHAEHYARILMKSQKIQAERQAEQQAQRQAKQAEAEAKEQVKAEKKEEKQPEVASDSFETITEDTPADSNLVSTPEDKVASDKGSASSASMMPEMPESEPSVAE